MDTTAPDPLSLAVHSDENDDDIDDGLMSSQSSDYGGDDMGSGMNDDVTAQLAASGKLDYRTKCNIRPTMSLQSSPTIARKYSYSEVLRKYSVLTSTELPILKIMKL